MVIYLFLTFVTKSNKSLGGCERHVVIWYWFLFCFLLGFSRPQTPCGGVFAALFGGVVEVFPLPFTRGGLGWGLWGMFVVLFGGGMGIWCGLVFFWDLKWFCER
jgi:hypothetical protein